MHTVKCWSIMARKDWVLFKFAGRSSATWPVFPEHTVNKVLERICTQRLVHISRGDLHIYVDEYSFGDISTNQSLCCCVRWHWYAVITAVQISETSRLINSHVRREICERRLIVCFSALTLWLWKRVAQIPCTVMMLVSIIVWCETSLDRCKPMKWELGLCRIHTQDDVVRCRPSLRRTTSDEKRYANDMHKYW